MKIASNSRSQKYAILRFISDAALIPIIVVVAYSLKFKVGWFFQNILSLQLGKIYQQAQIEPYIAEFGMIGIIWLSTFYFVGMYQPKSGIMPEVDEWVSVVKGVSIATIELMAFTFIYKSFPGSRAVIANMWAVGICFLIFFRILIFQYEVRERKSGNLNRRTIVIGENEVALDLIEKLILFPTLGFNYIGSIANGDIKNDLYTIQNKLIHLGKPDQMDTILNTHHPKVIVVTNPETTNLPALKKYCGTKTIDLFILPEAADVMTSLACIDELDSIPVYHYYPYAPNPVQKRIKAVFDRTVAFLGLIILSPVFAIIAIVIKFVSPGGPVFFMQERLTVGGKTFNMIKFRTMVPNAEANTGPVMVSEKNEARYIKYGQFLRQSSLDELPQLINVLLGDMSLVGPRPERPHFASQFLERIPHFDRRLMVKAGITGWAQINGRSALTSRPEYKIKYDLYYIKNWTIVLDIKILIKTIWIVFKKEEAY